MGKYLMTGIYQGGDGRTGLLAEGGSSRSTAVSTLMESFGGTVDSIYYCFGDDDLVAVVDLPSDEAAMAVALSVTAAGRVTVKTTPLMTAEQVDEAAKLTGKYRAPGT